MDDAHEQPGDTGGDTRVRSRPPANPRGTATRGAPRSPGHRSGELAEASDATGRPCGPDRRASDGDDTLLRPPAAKRLKSGPRASPAGTQDADRAGVQETMLLLASLSEEQLTRYEVYRRAAFPRAVMKRLVQQVAGCAVSQNVLIAMSGLAKVFVGEVVEAALDVCEQWGDAPPLQPKHLREAVRRLSAKGQGPHTKPRTF